MEYWQYWNNLFLMHSSSRPHLHLISIPRGIRARVRVRFCHYLNSHGTSCHGNLLFTRLLIGWELWLEFNPLFQGFCSSLPDVSKCKKTFPRVKTLFGALNFGKIELYFERQANCIMSLGKKYTESHTHTDVKRWFILTCTRHTSKYRKPDEYKISKQRYWGGYGKPDEYKSRKQRCNDANTEKKYGKPED